MLHVLGLKTGRVAKHGAFYIPNDGTYAPDIISAFRQHFLRA